LLCKDKEHTESLNNWRPTSLLNLDYKILSKVISNRLSMVISELVYIDQTCAVPGRSILDNTNLLRSVIDYVNQKQIFCGILSLDQQKAFDRVDHSFMFACLEKYGFGKNFLQWVKILYTDVSSSVIVNQYISEPFSVTRSVRQGCSLSPLLYILVLEPFLRRIMIEQRIEGLSIPGVSHTLKYIAFADDVNNIFTSEKSIHYVFEICKLYSQVSGSKLNVSKTKGIWLGKWKERSDHPFGISWIDSYKFYGLYFGNENYLEENWNKIFLKFFNSLNDHRQRQISLKGKCSIIHSLACSKLWYAGSVLNMSTPYITQFQRALFRFFWGSNIESVKRTVVMNNLDKGGFKIVNIAVKLQALKLSQIKKLLLGSKANWTHCAIYWIGISLRNHRPELASNSIPHSDYCPPYYKTCLSIYKDFCTRFPTLDLMSLNTKQFYEVLIQKHVTSATVERKFPQIDFPYVWKNISIPFIDPNIQSFLWKTVHQILPVNYDLWRHNISRNKYCPLCNNIETIFHLFCECAIVKPLWQIIFPIICIYTGQNIARSNEVIIFNIIPTTGNQYTKEVALFMLASAKFSIWNCRNKSKYNNKDITSNTIIMNFLYYLRFRILTDFHRFKLEVFKKYWCHSDGFCIVNAQNNLILQI